MSENVNRDSVASHCDPPTYWPLGGRLDGDCVIVMVSRRGQAHSETWVEWKQLLLENGIVLGKNDLLMSKDYEQFEQVMRKAGWVTRFIAFGP